MATASNFKVPRTKITYYQLGQDLPNFEWEDIRSGKFIRQGGFGAVMLATMEQESSGRKKEEQIVVKQPNDITGHEKE